MHTILAWLRAHKDDIFRFLESTGGAATITVVLGGLVGTLLNSCIQASLLEREHALVAYQNRLERERRNMEQMYHVIGEAVTAAENLIGLTDDAFDPDNYSGAAAAAVTEQRLALIREYNMLDAKWRAGQYVQDLQVAYYDQNSSDAIVQEWNSLEAAVTKLRKCAEDVFRRHREDPSIDTAGECDGEKDTAAVRLETLTAMLSTMSRGLLYPDGSAP